MHTIKYHFDYFDNDFENNLENCSGAWNLEHNAVELQEILNRIMQRIMSIITSALVNNLIILKNSHFRP